MTLSLPDARCSVVEDDLVKCDQFRFKMQLTYNQGKKRHSAIIWREDLVIGRGGGAVAADDNHDFHQIAEARRGMV